MMRRKAPGLASHWLSIWSLFFAVSGAAWGDPAPPKDAQTILVPSRVIRAQEVIAPGDILAAAGQSLGALTDPSAIIGREARIALYPGRPIRAQDLGEPALIERNQTVGLIYQRGALNITIEGRALDRAGFGETIRVMNTNSRQTILGTVGADGNVYVAQP